MESQNSAAVRATRLRDNKRNYRSRQKEYVAELERTVREHRERGVQATKEVQLSALKVVRENTRLRQLLQKSGVDEGTIEAWLCDDSAAHGETADLVHGHELLGTRGPLARLTFGDNQAKSAIQTGGEQAAPVPRSASPCTDATESTSRRCHQSPPRCGEGPQRDESLSNDKDVPVQDAPVQDAPVQDSPKEQLAPCKLATRLAGNCNADIARSAFDLHDIAISDDGIEQEEDGVECSKALRMLSSFATTEEKLESVARALENGCVPVKGKKGRCKVKNESIWTALDEVLK